MTGKQEAVAWIGLIIIALNLFANWSQLKSILFVATGSTKSTTSSTSTPTNTQKTPTSVAV